MSNSTKLALLTLGLMALALVVQWLIAPYVSSLVFSLLIGVYAVMMVVVVAAAQRYLASRDGRRD